MPSYIHRIEQIVFDPLALLWRSVRKLNARYLKKNITSLREALLSVDEEMVNIVGMAPLHYFVLYFNKLVQKGACIIYFTSWPYWDFNDKHNRWVHCYPIDLRYVWKNFLSSVSGIVCVNKLGCRFLQRYADKVFWIPHSVDTNIFKPSTNRRNKPYIVVLFVGRLVESKGILELLEVIKRIKRDNINNLVFWFVGDGPYRRIIKRYKRELPVKYLGYINNSNILARIYANADILVLPSKHRRAWEELFGIVLIEAMSAGLPVIASNHVGPRDIVNDGYDGFLIKAEPLKERELFINEMYDKIITLVENEKLRIKMGERGRKKAQQLYDVRVNMKKWVEVLRRLE